MKKYIKSVKLEERMNYMKKTLNANQLKLIAVCAMIFDHLIWVIQPGYTGGVFLILHLIGRIVAPIFCFFIAEGAYYTHDRKKYLTRLLIFAVISHFAYCFAFGINFIPFSNGTFFNQTSIMWSLALGLIGIMIQESNLNNKLKAGLVILLCILGFPSDWSSVAVMIIIYDYVYRKDFKKQMKIQTIFSGIYAAVYCAFINVSYGLLQMGTVLAIPLLNKYNGQRGKWAGMKYFFYLIYPIHLIICGIIRIYLHGNISAMIG